jgi:hypothetical protein
MHAGATLSHRLGKLKQFPPLHLLFDAHGDPFYEFKRYVGLRLRLPLADCPHGMTR